MRLAKLLAAAGVASRRRAEALIREGQVRVNGEPVTALGTQVDPARDRVEVEGRRVRPAEPLYRALLKPRGCLATLGGEAKERQRPTLDRFVPDPEVGWKVAAPLDFPAEGVILLTTDGALAERLARGGGGVPMTYHLKLQGMVSPEEVERLRRGWRYEGRRPVRATRAERLATTGKNTWIEIEVAEARPRVLKAAGDALRHQVLKISRVRLGPVSFEGLGMGGFRDLTKAEVAALRRAAGLG